MKRIISSLVFIAMFTAILTISASAVPILYESTVVFGDNASVIIQVDELEDDLVTVTAKLKGTVNIKAYYFTVSYDATKVVPYNIANDTVLGNEKLTTKEEVSPYFESYLEDISEIVYINDVAIIDNMSSDKYFAIGFSTSNPYPISVTDESEFPLFKVNFKKLSGEEINESTFNFVKIYDAPTSWVSKIIYNTVNICFDDPEAEAGDSVIHIMPEAFTKEVNLLNPGKELTGISIKTLPDKAVYSVGDTLDTTGMVVEAEYSDDTTAVITGYTCQPTELINDNIHNIVVSYNEGGVIKTAEFDIVVRKQPLALAGNGNIQATMSNASAGGVDIVGGIINSSRPGFQQGSNNAFTYGTEITLTAQPVDGMSFLYWKNSPSERIVSTNAEFTFKIGSNTQLTAVYKKIEAGKFHIEFYDKNGKVLQSNYLSSTDRITPPETDPFTVGYEFDGWSPNVPQYPEKDEAFVAQYNKEDTSYQLTVNGPAVIEKGALTNLYNTEVALAVNSDSIPEGQRFLCWKRDGRVVGYENTYSFYVWDDTEITAVCASSSAEIEKTPQVMMDRVKEYSDPNRLVFMSERIIPDGYEYIESGILLKQGLGDENSLSLTDGNFDAKAVSSSDNINGQFAVRRDKVTDNWYARAYIIYKDGAEVKVAYSDIVDGFRKK